jgi:hypothetical protein
MLCFKDDLSLVHTAVAIAASGRVSQAVRDQLIDHAIVLASRIENNLSRIVQTAQTLSLLSSDKRKALTEMLLAEARREEDAPKAILAIATQLPSEEKGALIDEALVAVQGDPSKRDALPSIAACVMEPQRSNLLRDYFEFVHSKIPSERLKAVAAAVNLADPILGLAALEDIIDLSEFINRGTFLFEFDAFLDSFTSAEGLEGVRCLLSSLEEVAIVYP